MNWVFKEKESLDLSRWDELISESAYGLPYGYSWYLSAISNKWGGFVLDNYRAICPIPFKSYMFFKKRIFQPLFCQQLGIYTKETITPATFSALLQEMIQFGAKIHYHFNFSNLEFLEPKKEITIRQNSILRLNQPYETIKAKYAHGLMSSLKNISVSDFNMEEDLAIESFIQLYKTHQVGKLGDLRRRHFKKLSTLMNELNNRKYLKTILIKNLEEKLLCGAAFQIYQQRIIYFLGFSTALGRKENAMSFLLDHMIQKNVENKRIFDFEGSEIHGVQQFFSRFGISDQKYPVWVNNY